MVVVPVPVPAAAAVVVVVVVGAVVVVVVVVVLVVVLVVMVIVIRAAAGVINSGSSSSSSSSRRSSSSSSATASGSSLEYIVSYRIPAPYSNYSGPHGQISRILIALWFFADAAQERLPRPSAAGLVRPQPSIYLPAYLFTYLATCIPAYLLIYLAS